MLPPSSPQSSASKLSIPDCRELLALARHAIVDAVVHDRVPDLPSPTSGPLSEHRGAFVTLYRRGRLRGCVGQTKASHALAETVARCAISAVLGDPRFAPVKPDEVGELTIEISVLSELQPISWQTIEDPPSEEEKSRFEVGKHGLLVARGAERGLLLPQVAQERHWSAKRFVEEVCRKAGLEPEAWRNHETQIFTFTVEAFSEAELQQVSMA